MEQAEIINQIRDKISINILINQALIDNKQIEIHINIIETEKSSIKFTSEKVLRLISEKHPNLIYPYFGFFVKLLDSDNSFIKWGAIITLSNLAVVDSENQFDKIFAKYFSLITASVMISAANVIGNSWKIADTKPVLISRIVDEILKLEKAKYYNKGKISPECNNVIAGEAIDTFEKIIEKVKDKKKILAFVKRQLNNPRAKVKKKAERFIKIYGSIL
ncbi:MAG: hypothetical protein ABIJ97_09090 [Bacteroidota bacterium]